MSKPTQPTLKSHPAASVFPEMPAEDYERLKNDIEEHGQREAVVLWHDGTILDGRNRYRACCELGIECEFVEFKKDMDEDPHAFAVSMNIHRRHLTTTQRSMIGAKIATLKVGDVTSQKDGGSNDPPSSIDQAAKALKVSPKSVKRAKHVINNASDDLVEAVERDEIPVSLAAKLVDEVDDPAEQTRLAKEGPKAIREYLDPGDDYVEVGEEPGEVCDCRGEVVPESLIDTFQDNSDFDRVLREFNAVAKWLTEVMKERRGNLIARAINDMRTSIRQIKQSVRFGKPYAVCPDCEGEGEVAGVECGSCMSAGWLNEEDHERATRAMEAS